MSTGVVILGGNVVGVRLNNNVGNETFESILVMTEHISFPKMYD